MNPSKLSMLDADKQAKVRTACVAHQFWLAHCPTQRVVRLASVQIQIPILMQQVWSDMEVQYEVGLRVQRSRAGLGSWMTRPM